MQLAEIAEDLPKNAGKAVLWYSEIERLPVRNGSVITLPKIASAEFFDLKDGKQFLFSVPKQNGVWFGGTDENPFLSHLGDGPFQAYREQGENGFYDSLKPSAVKELEEIMGVAAKRQGDFFFIPAPYSFSRFLELALQTCGMLGVEVSEEKDSPIFGTRHILKGLQLHFRTRKLRDVKEYNSRKNGFGALNLNSESNFVVADITLGEGVVETPDHSPRNLEIPHFILQAQGFFNTQVAITAD